MEVQIATLCDAATDYNGKLCVLGTFDTILSQHFPFFQPQCSIALRLLFRADDEGTLALKISLVNEDGQPLVAPIETNMEVTLPDEASFMTRNIVFNLQHLKFERPGNYSADVTINGRPLTGIPFRIVQFPQQQPGQFPINE
jgi:hypothetical protein